VGEECREAQERGFESSSPDTDAIIGGSNSHLPIKKRAFATGVTRVVFFLFFHLEEVELIRPLRPPEFPDPLTKFVDGFHRDQHLGFRPSILSDLSVFRSPASCNKKAT